MTDRTPLVAANWKMNGTLSSIRPLLAGILAGIGDDCSAEVAICPPFVYLAELATTLENSRIRLGVQNVSHLESGAYTGEVSFTMLRDLVHYVIVGHSDRRHKFGEVDKIIGLKVGAALRNGLSPILCVGETNAEEVNLSSLKFLSQTIIRVYILLVLLGMALWHFAMQNHATHLLARGVYLSLSFAEAIFSLVRSYYLMTTLVVTIPSFPKTSVTLTAIVYSPDFS